VLVDLEASTNRMKPKKKKNVPRSALKVARTLLEKNKDELLEELRMHDFPDDESAHDDELTERLYAEFSAEVESVQAELSKEYGSPLRKGKSDTKSIPLNGVFCYAIWQVADRHLFVAANHEDRGIPIVLWIGTAPRWGRK
jgi:hypothetical protein